jgi:pimeloyl-ACP methyl ester carboxylesterase
MPRGYAKRFAELLGGPSELRIIAGAGHLAELDNPGEVAAAILEWTKTA